MLRSQAEIDSATKRADYYYHNRIKHQLTDADKGRYVAIDVKTGEWEIADGREAVDHLRKRVPDAEIHLLRHIIMHTVSFGYSVRGRSD